MKARARFAMLITLLVVGGIGADWWMDGVSAAPAQADVNRLDDPNPPPPTPSPMP